MSENPQCPICGLGMRKIKGRWKYVCTSCGRKFTEDQIKAIDQGQQSL